MDPLTLVGLGTTVIGGLKSLFQPKEDPEAQRREMMLEFMRRIESLPNVQRGAITSRASVERANALRSIEDAGASGGIGRSQIAQRQSQAYGQNLRGLFESLASLEESKLRGLEDLTRFSAQLPAQPTDRGPESLLGLGLQLLTSGGGMGFGEGADQLNQALQLQPVQANAPNLLPMPDTSQFKGGFSLSPNQQLGTGMMQLNKYTPTSFSSLNKNSKLNKLF